MNQESSYSSKRRFQMWRYSVSLGQLLLRSVKTSAQQYRIDLLFMNVSAINLIPSLDGIAINVVEPNAVSLPSIVTDALRERKVYQITTSGFSGYVVALSFTSHEDEGEYYEPSALLFKGLL